MLIKRNAGSYIQVTTERDLIKRARDAVKQEYGDLFFAVSAALFEDDPIGINFESNTDEYEPETETILPRLRSANSVHDVESIVYEEFNRWFGAGDAGLRSRYEAVSRRIWELWHVFQKSAKE